MPTVTPRPAWLFKPAHRRPGTRLTWFQSWLFLQSKRNRYTTAVAARRSGKTVGVRARIIDACLDPKAGDVGYMAPTLGQAKRLLWRPLMRDLRDPAAKDFVEGRPNHSELSVEFKSGVRLYLYSAEAFERVRGDGFKLFVTDESDDPLFTDEVFDEAVLPALSDNLGHLIQVGTPKGRGRLFREYRKGQPGEHRDAGYASIQVPAWEAGIIDPSEIERARRTRPKRAFDQEYGATFNAPIGLVYDEWNEERHVFEAHEMPARDEFDDVVVGVDFGTAARGAMVVAGIDRIVVPAVDDLDEDEQTRVWLAEEHSESGLAYADRSGDRMGWWGIARQIQKAWRPSVWYYDPAGGSEDATEARAAGLGRQLADVLHEVDPRVKVLPADNRVGPGIAAVQQHLHYDDLLKEPPRMRVSRSCKWSIKEFASYRWAGARGKEDEFEDKPVKSNDHCFVAGTLVTTDAGQVPIEDIRPGMRVLTREGFFPVKAAGLTRASAEVWALATRAGVVVVGTPDHLFWTERGWTQMRNLRASHVLRTSDGQGHAAKLSWAGAAPVFDLTVDGPPEFFANGILVHNCMDATRYALYTHLYSNRRRTRREHSSWEDRAA